MLLANLAPVLILPLFFKFKPVENKELQRRVENLRRRTKAQIRGTTLDGQGKWSLEGDYPGSGTLRFSRLSVATLHDLVMLRGTAAQKAAAPPFEGFLEGGATVNVALRNLQAFRADVKIDSLQINAKPGQSLRMDVQTQDVQIRNTQPVLVMRFEAENEAQARLAVPPLVRGQARVTKLNKFDASMPFLHQT